MAPTRHSRARNPTALHLLSRFPLSRLAHALALHSLYLSLGMAAGMSAMQGAWADSVDEGVARRLDWVPLEELTEEQRKTVPTACCGAYIAPARTDPEADMDPEKASLLGSANMSELEQQSTVVLREDVRLTQGRRSISTDLFKLDKESSEAELRGNIMMREPGLLVRAESARMNIQSGDGRLDNAEFVLYETRIHGRADSLEKFGDNVIVLEGGSLTSCEPGDNTWSIEGSNITIHNDKRYGTAKHMRLEVLDVPVAYAPYFRFPVGPDRLTGFLFPSIGVGTDGITELSVPFYWNIAPNLDATLTPRYLDDHGYLFYSEVRHMSPHFDTEFSGSFLHNDRDGLSKRQRSQLEQGLISEDEVYLYRGEDRWQYNLFQEGGRNQRWHTEIDYTEVSDTDYIRDIDRGAVDLNREAYVRQKFLMSYVGRNWQLSAKAEELQLLTETQLPYRELPRINANGRYRFNDWVLELRNEFTHFSQNTHYELPTDNLIFGDRMRADYGFGWDKEFTAGFIKPRVGVKMLGYQLEEDSLVAGADAEPGFITPQGSLDMGLYFERDKTLFNKGFTQTLEPRVFYLYRDYENQDSLFGLTANNRYLNFDSSILPLTYQQLFRDSRFSGGDRLDDTNQITFGLTSRFIDNRDGVERLRLGIGQITYLEDRNISLTAQADELARNRETSSMIAGLVSGQIGDNLRFTNDITYDQYNDQLYALSSSVRYMDDKYRIVNFGYRFSRDRQSLSPINPIPVRGEDLSQLDISTLWPVANQWSVIARANYDFNYNAELDAFVGLEYDDCCYRVRLLARRWVDFDLTSNFLESLDRDDFDQGIFVEIQLKGIGSLSRRISTLLDKAIIGFTEREQALQ
ncbi:LPS-assembly protein LptD [Cellvibrio japonicus]|uniref:LPS-assembly protein LptD n=1 Tax=Cellvibrio japonicus (strain Ueda107) TaxID=498211 RepID=B3PKV1_CELJU|nr:LPS-assembly protein LptD [Cellvibrio japonicus]ACE83973.1 putative organic solvent tolerance protein [Cellvibrio japonicus Ueda107]